MYTCMSILINVGALSNWFHVDLWASETSIAMFPCLLFVAVGLFFFFPFWLLDEIRMKNAIIV